MEPWQYSIDMQKVFLGPSELIGGMKIFTTIVEQSTEDIKEAPFPKTTQSKKFVLTKLGKFTLVLEVIDVLIKIVDTVNENFYL